jgi:peptidoglycan/LPS O-acetylase OafA/YrhL
VLLLILAVALIVSLVFAYLTLQAIERPLHRLVWPRTSSAPAT